MQATTKTFLVTATLVLTMGASICLQARMLAAGAERRGAVIGAAGQSGLGAPRRAPIASAPGGLIVPVDGVPAADLTDTWGQARSQGRTHQGIDILAPAGTAVRAGQAGVVLKFHESARGGVTIYQADPTRAYVFYYAHLQARAPNLKEGDAVRQGDVIGYVGQTGDATTPHLHFEIERASQDRAWWRGQAFNPYPSLIAGKIIPPAG